MNPMVAQGTLNRLKASVTFPNLSGLNITSPYMSKHFVTVSFDGDFDNLIETATGGVTSPEPYVMATVSVGILRTQALASQWLVQAQAISDIGEMSVFSDTAAFPEIDLHNAILKHFDTGTYDGTDPVVKLTFKGIFYANNNLWTL
ncbi:MAG: hypothetical protein ACYC4K_02870 [Thiobacillus sp.]